VELRKKEMILKTCMIGLISAVLVFSIWIIIDSICFNPYRLELLSLVFGINFIVIGVAFGVSGLMNNGRMRKYFRDFYN
jgi:hypothetical protein